MIHPFIHLQTQVPFDQRLGLLPGDVVEPRHPEATDLEDVSKALGGDQASSGPFVLQDGIRSYGGAMHDLHNGGRRQAALSEGILQPPRDSADVVISSGGDLPGDETAIRSH